MSGLPTGCCECHAGIGMTWTLIWGPGMNRLGTFGRWAFAEFTDVSEFHGEFDKLVSGYLPEDAAT